MKKLISRINDFIEVNNQTFVHYVKGKKYVCLSTDNERDLQVLRKLYRSSKFELKDGFYVFDWYLERKDYFPFEKGIDRRKFIVLDPDEKHLENGYQSLMARIDKLWNQIINYGKENESDKNT